MADSKKISKIEFKDGSQEEALPGMYPDFPYIGTFVEFDQYLGSFVPWHWHRAVELFYIEKGALEYHTPKGNHVFTEGSGGFINSNVLHMTNPKRGEEHTIQFEHIFDPSLIGGQLGSRIEQRYVTPLITALQIEMVIFDCENSDQAGLLQLLRRSFQLSEEDIAYEISLRGLLSEIWSYLYRISIPLLQEKGHCNKANDKIKHMMTYIHSHFADKISISQMAAEAFVSERECYRTFQSCLHTTPTDYINSYRLQKACQMLVDTRESITDISHACGLGSSSYFGKVFREHLGCTPLEYRRRRQDNDINRRM